MPINAHPKYLNAEQEYHNALTNKEKIKALENMMRFMPKHKSAEALRKNIRTRHKKLKQEISKTKKSKTLKKGIKKQDMQAVLIGLTNSGKSSILKAITNANPKIASYGFTTSEPEIGTLNYKGCFIQIIDLPPIASENFEKGIINNADVLLIVVEKIDEIKSVLKSIKNHLTIKKPKIIIFNKIDIYNEDTKRKISETLKSKKYNFVLVSAITDAGIEELKEKILNSFNILRIYTKYSEKKEDKVPIILPPYSTIKDVAEKIFHKIEKVKYAKITGPSCKFPNQKVGLKHILKDRDVVEFFTK